MKNRLFLEETEYNKFFDFVENVIDGTNNKQLTRFLKWCFNKGFFDNITDEDLNFCYEANELSLPLLKNHHITIGIEVFKGFEYALIGIDPSYCFNKTKQCSIVAKLPLTSKRDEKAFYKLLDSLLDNKNQQTKKWKNYAGSSWYGVYASFNY